MARVAKLVAALAAVALAAACGDYGSITDVRPPDAIANDTVFPEIRLEAVSGNLEEGSVLSATVTDDNRVNVAVAFVLNSERKILWRSDTVKVERDSAVVRFPLDGLPANFPFGREVLFTVWARDAAGNARYAGGVAGDSVATRVLNPKPGYQWDEHLERCRKDDGQFAEDYYCWETKWTVSPSQVALTLAEADVQPFSVAFGRTFSLGEGVSFGGMAYDNLERMIYLTVPSRNEVRGLSIEKMELADWQIRVGSKPGLVAFQRYDWGVKPVLAVFNAGGTDVSIVDLSPHGAGGKERWRLPIPIIRVAIDGDTMNVRAAATSLLIHCTNAFCRDPLLYIGSPSVSSESRIATRTLAIADVDPNANFSVFAPEYRPGVITADAEISIEAWAVDPYSGTSTRILEPMTASRCGTLAIGTTKLAAPERFGGDLFLIEDGDAQGACGGSGRVLRFSRDDFGRYYISAPGITNFDFDPVLAGVEQVAANADGSLVLLRAGNQVFVTTGDLRRLGTVDVNGATAIAFLEGQTDGPSYLDGGALFAVATNEGVHIFEAAHFSEVAYYPTASAFGSELLFLRTGERGELSLFGLTRNGEGLLVVPTSLQALGR